MKRKLSTSTLPGNLKKTMEHEGDNYTNCDWCFFLIIRSGLLAEIRWSVCMSKSYWSLLVSFSRTAAGLCIYHLFVWSNLNLLPISQWITLPTQPFLVLYSFCTNLLHLLIMWLMVSSLSPYNLHFVSITTLLLLLFYSLRVSHINVSRWCFTGVCVTSLLKSLGLLFVFLLLLSIF